MDYTTQTPAFIKSLPMEARNVAFRQFMQAGYSAKQALKMAGL